VPAAVAVDEAGREVGHGRGPNSLDGWRELAPWATALGAPCRWGIAGARNDGRGLAPHRVAAGAAVDASNPRWTAAGRWRARRPDKHDRRDAQASALLVWRAAAGLPQVVADDETAVRDLLVTERDDVVAEMTRLRNHLHQRLLQRDPEYAAHLPKRRSKAGLRALAASTTADTSPVQPHRAAAVQRLGQRLPLLTDQAKALAAQLRALAAPRFAPLATICGIDLLTAGALAGIRGPGQRFASDAQRAAYAGVAPREASSAARVRHRLNRGGHRRLNAILSRVAVTQARSSPQARAYRSRRAGEGKTKAEAIRALKRVLVRAIWRQWRQCLPAAAAAPAALAV
jgi:transposase